MNSFFHFLLLAAVSSAMQDITTASAFAVEETKKIARAVILIIFTDLNLFVA